MDFGLMFFASTAARMQCVTLAKFSSMSAR